MEDETNNALERYNRTLGENIPRQQDLLSFVRYLMDEALGIVKRMDQIRKGQELRDDEKGPFSIDAGSSIPDIPDDYEDYIPPKEAENDEKKSGKRKK